MSIEQFTEACKNGDIRLVTRLLQKNLQLVNQMTEVGLHLTSPLNEACRGGHLEVAKLLVEKGADVHCNGNSHTPLNEACQGGHLEVVKFLLEHGADVNIANAYKSSPFRVAQHNEYRPSSLTLACRGGHLEVAKFLVEKGADVHCNGHSYTPLNEACEGGHLEVARFLVIKAAAYVNSTDAHQNSPLKVACMKGHVKIVDFLLEEGAANNHHVFATACMRGNLEVLELLFQKASAKMFVNRHGDPLPSLPIACMGDNLELVKFLVKNGADPKQTDRNGRYPCELALNNNNLNVAAFLLEMGPLRVPGLDNWGLYGWTHLSKACREGNTRLAELLLDRGADVNRTDRSETPPLLLACQNSNVELVRVLLAKGANVSMTDASRTSPLLAACNNGCVEVVKALAEKGAIIGLHHNTLVTLLNQACQRGHLAIAQFLVAKGADINKANTEGNTPFMKASENGHLEVAQFLVAKGADINKANTEGNTPFMKACENGHLEVAQFLVAHGLDLDDAKLLHYASLNGNLQIAKLLVANGAKLDINISARWSPEIRDFLTKALLLQECLDPKMWDIEVKLRALLSGLTPDMLEVFQERLECTIPKLRLLYPQKISFYKHLIKLLGGDISKNQALTPKEKQEALKGILNDPELLGKIAGACTAIKTPAPKTLVYSAALELIQSMIKGAIPLNVIEELPDGMLKLLKEIIEDIPDSDAKKSVTNTLTPIIKNREQEQAREKATKLEALVQTAYNESTGEFNPVNLYEFLEKNPTLCGYATVIFGTKFPSAPEDIIYSIKHSVDGIKHAAPDEPHEVHTLGDGV